MRGLIALGIIAFMVGLGVVVGNRMSSEAMAVVVGVVCGVLAGIPTAVLMLVVMRAQQRGTAKGRGIEERPAQPPAQYPPVIVVNPGGHQQLPQRDAGLPVRLPVPWQTGRTQTGAVDGAWRALEEPRREFRVIGEE